MPYIRESKFAWRQLPHPKDRPHTTGGVVTAIRNLAKTYWRESMSKPTRDCQGRELIEHKINYLEDRKSADNVDICVFCRDLRAFLDDPENIYSLCENFLHSYGRENGNR